MQQIKKLNLKLSIHYSQDWESLMYLGEFIGGKKEDTVEITVLDMNLK